MTGSLQGDIEHIVGIYDKGIICQGEVINKMIDFAADSDVGFIMELLPERFRDLLREQKRTTGERQQWARQYHTKWSRPGFLSATDVG